MLKDTFHSKNKQLIKEQLQNLSPVERAYEKLTFLAKKDVDINKVEGLVKRIVEKENINYTSIISPDKSHVLINLLNDISIKVVIFYCKTD